MPDAPDRLPQLNDFPSLARRKAIIRQILTAVTVADLDSEHRHCGICREDYGEMDISEVRRDDPAQTDLPNPENPVSLPCSHVFGENCVIDWLMRYDTCPWCSATCLGPNTGFTYRESIPQDYLCVFP